MLIEFSVKNYRSIKDKQTLSMVANNKDNEHPNHLIDPQAPGLSNVKLLKSAAIYGANASGKSNLYKAGKFMRNLIVDESIRRNFLDEIDIAPFGFDSKSEKELSEFEIIFIHEGIRYQYGFAIKKKKVYKEWLIAYPNGKAQQWFYRFFNDEKKEYEWNFSTFLKGEKESLKEKTKFKTLFLSTAAQFNHRQLGNVYEWFKNCFRFLDYFESLSNSEITASIIDDKNEQSIIIRNILKQADLGVMDIKTKRNEFRNLESPTSKPNSIMDMFIKKLKEELIAWKFLHKKNDTGKNVYLTPNKESAGTRVLFSLLGPLVDSLNLGKTIFLDEIGSNLHPMLFRKLIEMVHSEELNKNGAQLIFTTHDTTQLNTDILRRDQVWFTEKNKEAATILYPLTDFKPRKEEALQKGYLAGRYGAIPFLGGLDF